MFISLGEDYSGDESDAAPENQSFEHQIASEYSSWEDDMCPRLVFISWNTWSSNFDFAID
jgi:hypothetical protein